MKITYLALTILITYFATLGLIPFLKFNFGQTPNKEAPIQINPFSRWNCFYIY